jgi:hypothetical protein
MPARGWTDSVLRARREIGRLLDESPSLRQGVAEMIDQEFPGARTLVRLALKDYGEQPLIDLDQVSYTEDQVLGDWMPEHA